MENEVVQEEFDFRVELELKISGKDAEEVSNKICKLEQISEKLGCKNYKLIDINKK